MPRVDITVEQLLQAVRELAPEEQRALREVLEDGRDGAAAAATDNWVERTRGILRLDPKVLEEIAESDEFGLWGE